MVAGGEGEGPRGGGKMKCLSYRVTYFHTVSRSRVCREITADKKQRRADLARLQATLEVHPLLQVGRGGDKHREQRERKRREPRGRL